MANQAALGDPPLSPHLNNYLHTDPNWSMTNILPEEKLLQTVDLVAKIVTILVEKKVSLEEAFAVARLVVELK